MTQASVKNFQLGAQGSSRVLMQFGRTSHKDIFVMDYEVRTCAACRLPRAAAVPDSVISLTSLCSTR